MAEVQLVGKFKFWYQHFIKGGDFQNSLFPVGIISKASQFWGFYQNIKRPRQLDQGSYIYLFKDNVKPIWEDPQNQNGGEFVLRFEKDKCDRIWEHILLTLISSTKKDLEGINGVRIKIRKDNNAEIDLWVSDSDNQEALERQRQWFLKAAQLDLETTIELLPFN